MKVFFEKIMPYHYLLVKGLLFRGHSVSMFNFDYDARKSPWLRHLLDSGKINKISHAIVGSDKFIYSSVEAVSASILKKSRLTTGMCRLYDSSEIELAYKKELVKQLSDFYSMQLIFKKEAEIFPGEMVLFYPGKYTKIFRMVARCKANLFETKNVVIPLTFRLYSGIDNFLQSIIGWFKINLFVVGSLIVLLSKALRLNKKNKIVSCVYSVSITNPAFQFKFNDYRRFDFILDGEKINKSNTAFLIFRPVSPVLFQDLKSKGYRLIDCSDKSIFLGNKFILSRSSLKLIGLVSRYGFGSFFSAFFEPRFVVEASLHLLYEFLRWMIILDNIYIANNISLNDEGLRHIGRNILFRKNSVQSWCYTYSSAYGYTHIGKDIPPEDMMHWMWFFLYYDHYVAWNRQIIEFQKMHPQKIRNYHSTGCLWSEFIAGGQKKIGLADFLSKYEVIGKETGDDLKVVSFFDTSYYESVYSKYPLKDGILFYNDINRLLREEKKLFVIVKEKKPRTLYSDISHFIYSPQNREFSFLIESLAKHPRCYVPGHGGDPTDIIKVSDLTVSYAFSSSAVEALGARKKAIFYDPADKFRGYYYDQIPGLVAHGYPELKNSIRKLVYETSDSDYDSYLEAEIRGKVDDYLDGKGLTRFRELLTKDAHDG